MNKYSVVVHEKDGKVHRIQADKINFHEGIGGIDIFPLSYDIPVFPCDEEDVLKVEVFPNFKPRE